MAMSRLNPAEIEVLKGIEANICREDSEIYSRYFGETAPRNNHPDLDARGNQLLREKDLEGIFKDYNISSFAEAARQIRQSESANFCDNIETEYATRTVFDPKRNGNVFIGPPIGVRKKNAEFDAFQFLVRERENQEGIELRLDADVDDYVNDIYFDDKIKKDVLSDQSLRKIAIAIKILNANSDYRLLDVHTEKIIR